MSEIKYTVDYIKELQEKYKELEKKLDQEAALCGNARTKCDELQFEIGALKAENKKLKKDVGVKE